MKSIGDIFLKGGEILCGIFGDEHCVVCGLLGFFIAYLRVQRSRVSNNLMGRILLAETMRLLLLNELALGMMKSSSASLYDRTKFGMVCTLYVTWIATARKQVRHHLF